MWRTAVPDAYRSQLYLRRLTNGLHDVAAMLTDLDVPPHEADIAIQELALNLARELDSILLPTIALELAIAKRLSLLAGVTPQYESRWRPSLEILSTSAKRS